MTDFKQDLLLGLAEETDPAQFAGARAAASARADRIIRRRRVAAGGAGAGALAVGVAAALLIPTSGASPAGAETLQPAGPGVASTTSATPTPAATTATKSTPRPGTPEAAGYLPHPELVKPGEPVPYLQFATNAKDDPAAGPIPHALPNPATGPYSGLVLHDFWGAHPRAASVAMAGCDPAYGGGTLRAKGARTYGFRPASALGATDGNHDPAIDRTTVFQNVSAWSPGIDAVGATLAEKTQCVYMEPQTTVPLTVAGADRAWMGQSTQPVELYGQHYTSAMAQRGTTLVSVRVYASTQAKSDEMAAWFIRAAITRLQTEQGR